MAAFRITYDKIFVEATAEERRAQMYQRDHALLEGAFAKRVKTMMGGQSWAEVWVMVDRSHILYYWHGGARPAPGDIPRKRIPLSELRLVDHQLPGGASTAASAPPPGGAGILELATAPTPRKTSSTYSMVLSALDSVADENAGRGNGGGDRGDAADVFGEWLVLLRNEHASSETTHDVAPPPRQPAGEEEKVGEGMVVGVTKLPAAAREERTKVAEFGK